MIRARLTALIVFGETHFLLVSGNKFFHEVKCGGITSFPQIRTLIILSFLLNHKLLKKCPWKCNQGVICSGYLSNRHWTLITIYVISGCAESWCAFFSASARCYNWKGITLLRALESRVGVVESVRWVGIVQSVSWRRRQGFYKAL